MVLHNCRVCNIELNIKNWHKSLERYGDYICKICSSKCNKQYREQNNETIKQNRKTYYDKNKTQILERDKLWRERNKIYLQNYNITHKRYHQKFWQDYYNINKDIILTKNKKYRQTQRGKTNAIKLQNRRQRELGFIPLNQYFEGSQAHHITIEVVIYIPKKIHRSIYHSLRKGINMNKINELAIRYYMEH